MKKLNRLALPIALLFIVAAVVGIATNAYAQELLPENQEQSQEQAEGEEAQNSDQSQEEGAPENSEDNQQPSEEQQDEAAGVYSYTAQPGDSYTLMARKAVQTYGLDNEVNLSEAQIIFAETNLTREADSPRLAIGQEVQIEQSRVQDWVEKAQQLSEEEQANWAVYTAGVNFNTNSVGEAS